jgi:hypothetical protein
MVSPAMDDFDAAGHVRKMPRNYDLYERRNGSIKRCIPL